MKILKMYSAVIMLGVIASCANCAEHGSVARESGESLLISALATGDDSIIVPLLRAQDWKVVQSEHPSLAEDVLNCFPDTSADDKDKAKNIRIKGWASYILGRLNGAQKLSEVQLARWASILNDESWYLFSQKPNPVNVAILGLGDYTDKDEFGLCYSITDKGLPSYPAFRHTHMEERFEFIEGHGYLVLEQAEIPALERVVSPQEFAVFVATKTVDPETRYLITVEPGSIITITEGTYIQICPTLDEQLRFLIYTTPPFSHLMAGRVKSEWQKKTTAYQTRSEVK